MLVTILAGCFVFLATNGCLLYASHLLVRRFFSHVPPAARMVAHGVLYYALIVLIFQALSPLHAIGRIWATVSCIAVALAVGPMVMINSATGFRRTDLAKIALARSYGASTFQIFTKIRFPLALPMIIVGLMVGAIFGMLTAVGAEMVGGKNGLGNQLMFWSSMVKMTNFLSLIHISEPTRLLSISYAVFCLKKKKTQ